MIDFGINIRIKTVLRRRSLGPRCWRLFFREADANDRLDTFKTVFPRYDQAQRRAVLIRQIDSIHPGRHNRQRMHCFLNRKPLNVGKIQNPGTLSRHLGRSDNGLERNIPGLRRRLESF